MMLTRLFISLSLCLFAAKSLAHFENKNFHILIDPGHGGSDQGAVYGSAKEAQIVYQISELLKKKLVETGFRVDLTRGAKEKLSLRQRVEKSKKYKTNLYVSLHANAVSDSRVQGFEYFFEPSASPAQKPKARPAQTLSQAAEVSEIMTDVKNQFRQRKSLFWAQKMNEQLPGNIKQAPFYVISQNDNPSLLIEVGFLSHPIESQKLRALNYQNEIAEKMAKVISNYAQQRRRIACATNSNSQSSKDSASVSGCDQTIEKITN